MQGDLLEIPTDFGPGCSGGLFRRAVAAGRHPRVEGHGARQADGSILARSIKGDDEDD